MRVCDLHNDLLTSRQLLRLNIEDDIKKYLRRVFSDYKKYGVDTLVLAAWTTQSPLSNINDIENVYYLATECADGLNIMLAIEDISCLTLEQIYALKHLSPCYASLTWNHKNNFGGGALASGGLTAEGKQAVKALCEMGAALDTAHLNPTTFYGVCGIEGVRMINSHTAFFDVNPHPRNIDKYQIQLIIENGGIIGLAFVGDFLCPDGHAQVDDLVMHIDWFVQNFGYQNLAIGSDFFGSDNLVLKNYDKIGLLVEKLIKIGYNNECVQSILYKNFHRFMR